MSALAPLHAEMLEEQIPALHRYARALTGGDPERAEDLVQDSLERAVSRFNQFEQGTSLRRWMFTILHNRWCDVGRRQKRSGTSVPIEDVQDRLSAPAGQFGYVELGEFARAFRRLPKADREILLLVAVEGFSHDEASEVLGVAVGTVKSRLFRARERLRTECRKAALPESRFAA